MAPVFVPSWHRFVYRLRCDADDVVSHVIDFLAILDVMGTNVYGIESTQYIGFGHDQFGNAVEHDGVFKCRKVNPSRAARPPGGRTEFVPQLPEFFAGFVFKFGGKWPPANPCAIGFENTDDPADSGR